VLVLYQGTLEVQGPFWSDGEANQRPAARV